MIGMLTTADVGDVKFDVDLSTGLVFIRVRPALALESGRVTVALSIMEFLDKAAELTLGMNAATREAMARLRNGVPT